MRLVKILVDSEHRESVLSVLDDEGIDYLRIGVTGTDLDSEDDRILVEFPLPDQAVEYIREKLDDAGLKEEYLITLAAESAQTNHFEELEDRFITGLRKVIASRLTNCERPR